MSEILSAYDKMLVLRAASHVKRWHTVTTLRQQDLASHSHGVAMLVWQVNPYASYNSIMAALTHDLPELATGDIPAHVKWADGDISQVLNQIEQRWLNAHGIKHHNNLSDTDRDVLKFCDSFELMLWCLEELRLGNQTIIPIIKRIIIFISERGAPTEIGKDLFEEACRDAFKLIDRYN